jgi:N-acetylglucosaminyldiphosphoundecaprenol N-acetyl-beta-D-mannosaminyltransferase
MARTGTGVECWGSIVGRIRLVNTTGQEQQLLDSLVGGSRPRILAFVNAHAMNLSAESDSFSHAITAADVLLRDGSGMALLYRKLRLDPGLNMNGTDLIPRIIERYRGRSVAIWGTNEPFLSRAAARCRSEFGVQVISAENGFESFGHYLELARKLTPELIVLGMGMPKQEQLALQLRAALGNAPLIVCGGAILDFLGAKAVRAPLWMQRIGIEWLYRLCREPRRLFRRYVRGNPVFVLRLLGWDGARPVGS